MTTVEYLDAVKERLLTDRSVTRFQILRERITLADAHVRARLTFVDSSEMEFSEYVQIAPDDQINVVTYSYHWIDANGGLIRRWDNTPHYPNLPNSPHHVHDGQTNTVNPGHTMSIAVVLDEIGRRLTEQTS